MKVAIIYGGWSDEKEYTAHNEVKKAVDEMGYPNILVSVNDSEWISRIKSFGTDVAFITNQGNYGEDGLIQGTLDLYGIRYIGSGVLPSALIMNKFVYKRVLNAIKVKNPNYICCRYEENMPDYESISSKLGKCFIVKPVSNGASVGIELIESKSDFYKAINVRELYKDILFEEFISEKKMELGVGVLEKNGIPKVLPICMITYDSKFFSNEVKFSGKGVIEKYVDIDTPILKEAAEIARRIHIEMGCSGLSRTDMILTENNELYVLETNTLPGLLNNSLFPNQCKYAGISYREMVDILLQGAYRRKPFFVEKK